MNERHERPAGIRAQQWGWRHAGRRAWAVQDVTVTIEPGERVLLLGASGSGKSTMLHALAGVLGGDDEGEERGTLHVDGRDPRAARGTAGLVLQDPDAQVILSRVGDDVAFGCENLGVPVDDIWRRVDAALDAVGLDLPRAHPTEKLSGGQKQRLALAGALAMQPSVLLLDEPTANLDPAGARAVRDAVDRALSREQSTLVVVEHRIDLWLPLMTRVIVLDGGNIVADGEPQTVLAAEGERLARRGVWVPGYAPPVPDAPTRSVGDAVLSARALAVARSGQPPVLSGFDLDLCAGEVVALTGANGVGKSTTALTMAGLLPAASGTVAASPALARGAAANPAKWRSREIVTRIGTVFQDPEHQLLGRTVREEIEIGPRAARMPPPPTGELLERLRLDHLAEANPFTLSGGEKRRLTVAAILATRPAVLVLDEPTFGQDARTWSEIVALLAGIRDDGAAMAVVTHDADVVSALRAREVHLDAGRVAS